MATVHGDLPNTLKDKGFDNFTYFSGYLYSAGSAGGMESNEISG